MAAAQREGVELTGCNIPDDPLPVAPPPGGDEDTSASTSTVSTSNVTNLKIHFRRLGFTKAC